VKPRLLALAGTGTGVGKTHVASALLRVATHRGHPAVGLKPIESGVLDELGEDSRALAAHSVRRVLPPYRLREPLSPHLAARREGIAIRIDVASAWVRSNLSDFSLVETAGGLLSPLNESETNLDLLRELRPDALVLVSLDRLGVLHDVAAVVLALKSAGLAVDGVALNAPESADASSGTNAGELQRIHGLPVVAFPRAHAGDAESLASASLLLDRLL
jgi:dethiobiotin synthetase